MSLKSVTRALQIHVFPQMQIIIMGKGAVGPQLTGHRPRDHQVARGSEATPLGFQAGWALSKFFSLPGMTFEWSWKGGE